MDKEFGWCIIGCGHIAKKVVSQLKGTNHKIVSAYNRNFEKAQNFVNEFGGMAYKTLKEAVLAKGVSCAYIATSNDSHAILAKECINLGVPVLCEKPFALSEKEAKEVVDLAKKKKVYIAEAMWTWHDELSLRIKNIVKSNKIGEIKKAKITFGFPMLKPGDKSSRLVNPILGGGCLLDIGIYPIRHAYELFGMPKSIIAKGKLYNGIDIDDKVILNYDTFKVTTIFSFSKLKGEKMTLIGRNGKISNPFFHMSVGAKISGKNKEKLEGKGMFYAYVEEFDHTAQDVLNGEVESKYIPHQATIDTMKLLDEARKQMKVIFPQD